MKHAVYYKLLQKFLHNHDLLQTAYYLRLCSLLEKFLLKIISYGCFHIQCSWIFEAQISLLAQVEYFFVCSQIRKCCFSAEKERNLLLASYSLSMYDFVVQGFVLFARFFGNAGSRESLLLSSFPGRLPGQFLAHEHIQDVEIWNHCGAHHPERGNSPFFQLFVHDYLKYSRTNKIQFKNWPVWQKLS